jgi:hypothetical protein
MGLFARTPAMAKARSFAILAKRVPAIAPIGGNAP